MCRASLIFNSWFLLALSTTLTSSHLMGWCCCQACSAMAETFSSPLLQASWCYFTFCLLVVSPMCTLPQLQGILYTMDDLVIFDFSKMWSYSVLPDLNAVLMSKSLHTLWILSLNPAMYGIVRMKPFSCSVWSLEGNYLEPALIVRVCMLKKWGSLEILGESEMYGFF